MKMKMQLTGDVAFEVLLSMIAKGQKEKFVSCQKAWRKKLTPERIKDLGEELAKAGKSDWLRDEVSV